MGNRKLKWTTEEEEALMAGIAKHGVGKWKNILVDPQFASVLSNRTNVDLKDKWRNVGVNHGQAQGIIGTNVTTPRKGKATSTSDAVVTVTHQTKNTPVVLVPKGNSSDKPPQTPHDAKNAPNYTAIIIEAISTIKDHDGSDSGAIHGYIEKKYEVPQGFRKSLSSKLRRLASQGTLEKIEKRYKIRSAAPGTDTATPKEKDVKSNSVQNSRLTNSAETAEDAAKTAAHKIAEAENKSFLAAEAVKESERVSQMAEDADAVLMRLKEIFEQWDGKDDTILTRSHQVIYKV